MPHAIRVYFAASVLIFHSPAADISMPFRHVIFFSPSLLITLDSAASRAVDDVSSPERLFTPPYCLHWLILLLRYAFTLVMLID